jgi:hypothetical protein
LDDDKPSENEKQFFEQYWTSRRHGGKRKVEANLRRTLDLYRNEWNLVQAEAAFQSLTGVVSIMSAHVQVLTTYGFDEKRFIQPESDAAGNAVKLQLEAFAFALAEARKMKMQLGKIRRAIESEMKSNPCVSFDFENQSIETGGLVSKAVRLTGNVISPRTPFVRVCDGLVGPSVLLACAYGLWNASKKFR